MLKDHNAVTPIKALPGKLGIKRHSPSILYHILLNHRRNPMPPDKSAYCKAIFFYFSSKTYVVGTHKNRLNETDLLSTQNTCLN